MPIANAPISLRVSPSERETLEAAAWQSGTTLSGFVRNEAVAAAELAFMDRRVVTIPAADWDRFEAWANAPARDVPGLRELAAVRPGWQN